MNDPGARSLRNVAVIANRGAGKTSLAEAILFTTGAIPTLGSVMQGTSVSDFEPEEIHHRSSVSTSLLRCTWNQTAINLLDTPGALSLLGESITALQAADGVIVVLSPGSGIRSELVRLWSQVKALGLPCLMTIHTLAGKPAPISLLVDLDKLLEAYDRDAPDPSVAAQRVAFGTSGHRGSSFKRSFNHHHILAVVQAICEFRKRQATSGPLFLGMDTHALSKPALETTLQVLTANGVEVMIDQDDGYTPTPVISHAILTYNRRRATGLSDGIVITPSHNPPEDGGIKYNPPQGGPADTQVTKWIEERANALLTANLEGVKQMSTAQALRAPCVHRHDYLGTYVKDLEHVIDFAPIRAANLKLGIDPLGGSGVAYWSPLAERYGLNLEIVNPAVDGTFRFMPLDWDGKIRMDCSSPYAMANLIALKDRFDVAFGNDADNDRHDVEYDPRSIGARSSGAPSRRQSATAL